MNQNGLPPENEEVILTPIPSYKGLSNYLADSTNGRIWSIKKEKWLSTTPNDNGYVYNSVVHDDGTRDSYGVHRLVMASVSAIAIEHFKRGEIEVDHYPDEEARHNNSRYNLQMSSRKLQYRESTKAKMGKGRRLNENEVVDILTRLKEWMSDESNKISEFIKLSAVIYGQTYRNIHNIAYGKTWKSVYDKVIPNEG
jgi:hypothetical protein